MVQTACISEEGKIVPGPTSQVMPKVLIIDRGQDGQGLMDALQTEGFNVIRTADFVDSIGMASDPELSLIMVGEQTLSASNQESLPLSKLAGNVPVVLLHSGGHEVTAQAKQIGAEVHFSRTSPASYFIHYVRARLNWGRVSQTQPELVFAGA